ncbi:RIP metalloprotease RseP [Rhodobaculum claviforme]|uniref:Zinc metalloprotease n=1 Tax=Rhodobaculum claviforme TaxID=1549854 RepID=A0A934TL84_9RHOB|nr:RIP metalloprotease RseP [Rhodobaculum claviforme]MBK5927576.1 RIP metalloprotease RseP [Rhodobaculum claviforme]
MDILGLLPGFGNLAFTIAAFVVALSVIVAVHEYGHYIVGRWSGIEAEVFSIGFGPVLFSRVDRRGTRWQVAALPFGGYVKFLGDGDAASVRGRAGAGVDPRSTMHGAPLWARSATVAAGPLFNFALSILVFAGYFMVGGVAVDRPVVGTLKDLPTVAATELRPGDTILAVDGTDTPDTASFMRVIDEMPPQDIVRYTVERDGTLREVSGPYPFPPLAGTVQPQSAARDAGLAPGDLVLSVDGTPIAAFRELRERVAESGGTPVQLEVWRAGETFEITVAARAQDLPTADGGFEQRWLLGVTGAMVFDTETRRPGPLEALGIGVERTVFIARTSLSGLYHMITGAISSCNLRGPIGIAETSGAMASDGLASFIWFIAVLSTAVGLINLFPVPVLDGGHLVFHAYEAITGRPPSDRALQLLMAVGLAMILTLMVFAIGNDLFCP